MAWRAAYRRYRQAATAAERDEVSPQDAIAVAQAWRAMPLPLRLWLCVQSGCPGDALWELPRSRASVERRDRHDELMEHLSQAAAALGDLVPLVEAIAADVAEIRATGAREGT